LVGYVERALGPLEDTVDINKLTLGDKIAGICGVLLLIGLLFLPWHSVDLGFGVDYTRRAIQSPNAFWAWLAFLCTAGVVAIIIVDRLTEADLPELPIGYYQLAFFLSIAAGALLLLKLVVETDALGWGVWVNLILAGGMIYGGFLIFQGGGEPSSSSGGTPPQPF
jgi:hypothetical protein